MSIVIGIESLKRLVDRLGDDADHGVVPELLAQMRAVGEEARGADFDQLSALCHAAAETVATLCANERMPEDAEQVVAQLRDVVAYAERSVEQGRESESASAVLQAAAVADEQALFAATLTMFVDTANRLLDELAGLLPSEGPDESGSSAMRSHLSALANEFGVLGMHAPRALCEVAGAAVGRAIATSAPLPVAELVDTIAQLRAFVARIGSEVDVEPEDTAPLIQRLNAAVADVEGADEPLTLQPAGEFADGLPEFLADARAQLDRSTKAFRGLSRYGKHDDHYAACGAAWSSIGRVAEFLELAPVAALARAACALLAGGRAKHFVFDTTDRALVRSAHKLVGGMFDALDGAEAPAVSEWRALVGDMQQRAARRRPPADAAAATMDAAAAVEAPAPAPTNVRAVAVAEATVQAPADTPAVATAVVARRRTAVGRAPRSVKVSAERVDALLDGVGELFRVLGPLRDFAGIDAVTGVARELQDAAFELRLVPLSATFDKLGRIVRDATRKHDRLVAWSVADVAVELDRDVAEQVLDPLARLLRCVVEHGIEAPAQRLAAGKPEEARLSFGVRHQACAVVFELTDDGAGEPEAVAIDDVLGEVLAAAGATITVDGRSGRGCVHTLTVPLAHAVLDGAVLAVGERRFAVPTLAIEGAGEQAGDPPDLELCDPSWLLGEPDDGGVRMVVRDGPRRATLRVDRVIGHQRLFVQPLGVAPEHAGPVAGGAIVGDGEVVLVADVPALLDLAEARR